MNRLVWKDLLQKLRVFETVRDEKAFDKLLDEGASTERVFAKDEVITRKGWIGDSIFLVGTGAVEILLEPSDGNPIVLAALGRGEIFGEMAFFDRAKRIERSATVRAAEPSTVLEIHAPALQALLDEHPDVEFKLLLTVTDRLRHANAQILGLQRSNIDEKLKLMNARLDAEHRVFDAQLTAASKVFDQTKLRADEVITSAERSRDRLNKTALLVGTFVTVATGLFGLFGWNKVSDIERARVEVAASATKASEFKDKIEKSARDAEASATEMKNLKEQAVQSNNEAKQQLGAVQELRESLIDIYRAKFSDALDKGSADVANQAYRQMGVIGAIAEELPTLLSDMERQVVARAQAPRSPQELSQTRTFAALIQQMVVDADPQKAREKLDAYYLLLVYASLTDQADFDQKNDKFKDLGTRKDALAAFQKYAESKAGARARPYSEELDKRLARESGTRAEELLGLSQLAKVSRRRP
jgi:CRP-like cAMP-binding protein